MTDNTKLKIVKILRFISYLGLFAILVIGGLSLAAIRTNSHNTDVNTAEIKKLVAKQDQTLQAIKDLATDNKITSEQKTNIIICMLQIPVQDRTTNTTEACRKQAESSTSSEPAPVNQPTQTTSQNPTIQYTQPTQNQQPTTPQDSGQNQNTGPVRTFLNSVVSGTESLIKKLPGVN